MVSRVEADGSLGSRDAEAEALLQVEPGGVGVVALVSNREILAGLEEEVASPHAHHGTTRNGGGPDDRAAPDLPQVLHQRIPAVLAGLEDAGMSLGAECEPVGPLDTGRPQLVDGLGDVPRVALAVLSERDP